MIIPVSRQKQPACVRYRSEKMKIMVVGGGGREHAIIKKLKENPEVSEI